MYLCFKSGHSPWTPTVVLTAVIYLFDNLREKRSVPLTKWSPTACFKNFVAHWLKMTHLEKEIQPSKYLPIFQYVKASLSRQGPLQSIPLQPFNFNILVVHLLHFTLGKVV